MQKVFVLTPEEFSVKIQAHILEVRQMGAVRNGFEEPVDGKTLGIIRKLQDFDEELLSTWSAAGMADVVVEYFSLYGKAVQQIDQLKDTVTVTDEEHLDKFCELALCMFITKELELMGVH